jgi:ABC-type phosphate transport system substrate-binding protein
MVKLRRFGSMLAAMLALTLVAAACGGDDDGAQGGTDATGLTGTINVSGSSTVEPISELVSDVFKYE